MNTTETHGGETATRTKPARDNSHDKIRATVREILTRSNLTVGKASAGKGEGKPIVTYAVTGEGVKAPFNRYYLGTKLEKRLADTGYRAELRRKERGVDSILVDVFTGEAE
jgi:hypothetical protein